MILIILTLSALNTLVMEDLHIYISFEIHAFTACRQKINEKEKNGFYLNLK